MDSWISNITKIAIGGILGWFSGVFTSLVNRDYETVKKCRGHLYELKKRIKKCKEFLGNTHEEQFVRVNEIKIIIEILVIEKSGLAFQSDVMNSLLEESESLFKDLNLNTIDPRQKPPYILTSLIAIWGLDKTKPNESDAFDSSIQEFLSKSFSSRCYSWVFSCFKRRKVHSIGNSKN